MFKAIRELFTRESLLEQAMVDVDGMLEKVEAMVSAAVPVLRQSEGTEVQIDIEAMDAAVNRFEEDVRRKVFTHLSLMGGEKVYPGLVLISIIVDVERAGDYAKNILTLSQQHPAPLRIPALDEEVSQIEEAIVGRVIPEGRRIFIDNDEEGAKALIRDYRGLSKRCEAITHALAAGEHAGSVSPSTLVCMALYARFLKRILSHWLNLMTALANPFDRIGVKTDLGPR